MGGNRGGGALADVTRPVPRRLDRCGPERGGVGVETEDDLAAPLFDQRSQTVREQRWVQPPLTRFLSALPAENLGT